ncbi:MAG: PEP-CTERM sorting domain-containing protein [Pirellulales bacterium]|nr:PEP-CTERM sorting domain-containing protein [Pirellulales bacterium]
MRHFLAALAIAAFLCASASATIVVDGDYSDWTTLGLVKMDGTGDNPGGAVDIDHYGVTIIDGVLYGFAEITEPLTPYVLGTRGFSNGPSMGFWIDADQSTATALTGDGMEITELSGTDIMVEVNDFFEAAIGVNFYGENDDVGTMIPGYDDGNAGTVAYISDGYVIEWSAPVIDILTALGGLDDGVDGSFDWTVYIAGEGKIKNADGFTALSWGRDVAGPVTVPEPGTLALLAAAGLTLALVAARKRK